MTEREIVRYVDGEPRWAVLKCWEIRQAEHRECKIGRGINK